EHLPLFRGKSTVVAVLPYPPASGFGLYFRASSTKLLNSFCDAASVSNPRSGCHCTANTKCSGFVPSTASTTSSSDRATTRRPSSQRLQSITESKHRLVHVVGGLQ